MFIKINSQINECFCLKWQCNVPLKSICSINLMKHLYHSGFFKKAYMHFLNGYPIYEPFENNAISENDNIYCRNLFQKLNDFFCDNMKDFP